MALSFREIAVARELGRLGIWNPWLQSVWGDANVRTVYNLGKREGAGQPPLLQDGPQSFANKPQSPYMGAPNFASAPAQHHPSQAPPGTPAQPGSPGSGGTPPYLDPADALARSRELGELDLREIASREEIEALEAEDPYLRQQIEYNYKRSRQAREGNLAERGLLATGVHDAQLFDVDRERQLSNLQQDRAMFAARKRREDFNRWFTGQRAALELGYLGMHHPGEAPTPGTGGTPAKPGTPPPQAGGGKSAYQPPKQATVRRPAPGKATTLLPGQQLTTPSGRPIRVGLGGSKAYTISPAVPGSPKGAIQVTRRRR